MSSRMASEPTGQTPKRPVKISQSLNHLLNFTLPPRQPRPQSLPRRRKKPSEHGIQSTERFVNAQHRFVVDPSGDYPVHFADPDIFFRWQDILQVIVPRTSTFALVSLANGEARAQDEGLTTCPICLISPPVAPRMTRCGHVFCFPCILHYLSMSNTNQWARCPICFDSVNEKQLKSVKWYESPAEDHESLISGSPAPPSTRDGGEAASSTGPLLRMRLMQRPKITTLALPRSSTWPSEHLPSHQAPFHFLPDVYSFAKFMLATPEYLITNLSHELDALAAERLVLASIKDEISLVFIDAAEEKLRHQIAKAAALESPLGVRTPCARVERRHGVTASVDGSLETSGSALSDAPEAFLATQALHPLVISSATPPSSTSPPLGPETPLPCRSHKQRRNLNPPPPSTETYYYYQAASGLPIFLHPLDITILLSHFRSYASFPDNIAVRIEAASEGSVNDDLRRRCKYLAHMPRGADVVFVEADLARVVGQDGLRPFEGALRQRTARRREKGRRDDHARARAEVQARERERLFRESTTAATVRAGLAVAPAPPALAVPSAVAAENAERASAPAPVASGAWGQKSFAAALHSKPASAVRPGLGSGPGNRPAAKTVGEWDLDAAWHELELELEEKAGGPKKRGSKLLLLSGGTGGRRR